VTSQMKAERREPPGVWLGAGKWKRCGANRPVFGVLDSNPIERWTNLSRCHRAACAAPLTNTGPLGIECSDTSWVLTVAL